MARRSVCIVDFGAQLAIDSGDQQRSCMAGDALREPCIVSSCRSDLGDVATRIFG